MPFQRFVETGRIAYIADGPYQGKLCAIVDVINQTRALVDGPESGVPRCGIRLNQLHLTKFRIRFPFTASTRVVRKAWKDSNLDAKWKESVWAKKLEAKKIRASMNDFDRFRLNNARRTRSKITTNAFLLLKKQAKKAKKTEVKSDKKAKDKKPDAKKGAAKKAEKKK
ncbi:large ribosomal subunit protein eL14 [Halyomorpha halys]|uniref:large ribosomal subunit protein eL14 n=1 Tax=Halyomorpha halys TaxID=286706 RepID=UPI0006D4F081|nr:60S ribosomal protein L14 [Halyomorpha halys]